MIFDGVNFPILQVSLAIGAVTSTDPNSGVFTLDVSQLDTGQVGGTLSWVDIAPDCTQVQYVRGDQSELEDAQPGTCTITIDNTSGNYDPRNSSGIYFGNLDLGVPIWIRAIWNGVTYDRFRGFIGDIDNDVGNTPVTTLTCYDGLAVVAGAVFTSNYPDGDTAGTRVTNILNSANWPTSLRSIETGSYTMQATTPAGNGALSGLQWLNDVKDSEFGLLAQDGAGNIVFLGRLHVYTASRSMNVQATFNDLNNGNTDMDQLVLTRGIELLFNEAQITRNGGTTQTYDDTSGSQTKYGLRTFGGTSSAFGSSGGTNAGIMLRTDADAFTLASWIVGRFKLPQDRFKTLTVDMAMLKDQWPNVLPLTYLDRIQMGSRTYGQGIVEPALNGLILSIGENIQQDSWVFTFTTRNVDTFQPFILDTSHLNTGTVA